MPKSRTRTKKKHTVSKASRERQRVNNFKKRQAKDNAANDAEMRRLANQMGINPNILGL